ncbi:hypothetical protein NMY22_g14932 [Coprinellus aureogranulatus]|nr:hypothetical protein NMY22_g14932 [Coprinellus aureogranulatus]
MVTGEGDLHSEGLAFCGDIEDVSALDMLSFITLLLTRNSDLPPQLLPIGTVENAATVEDEDGNVEEFDCGHFSVDLDQGGMVFASGLAMKCDRENGHFDLHLIIYVGGMPKVENIPRSHITTITIHCYFPADSPRWKGSRPTPYDRRYVSVLGRLTGYQLAPTKGNWAARPGKFLLEITNIGFMGGQTGSSSPSSASISTVPNTF